MKKILIIFYVLGIIIIIYLIYRLIEKYRTEIIEPIIEEKTNKIKINKKDSFKNIIIEVTHNNIPI